MDKNDILEIFGSMLQVQGHLSRTCARIIEMLAPLAQSQAIDFAKLEQAVNDMDAINTTMATIGALLERHVSE